MPHLTKSFQSLTLTIVVFCSSTATTVRVKSLLDTEPGCLANDIDERPTGRGHPINGRLMHRGHHIDGRSKGCGHQPRSQML